ncbi:DUF930 domain-containing protein [Rhizobium sp. SSA_523]|uniref:DUF930 domain-containing protein n=1 Tax=Rhizobium sp. SSA_523 TaxID=2952477 RepID=UPI0020919D62|nr:DUF930 domain-containing protein [Rhizobium sp. SSA_523]MCO5731915.1 DUF930 domain-containing protein [Rhizobium sp. SSA_523]WKC22732.1 DUF930 domain-containing protein [Rhizobium sp. SSA_523]
MNPVLRTAIAGLCLSIAVPALALDNRIVQQLDRLTPEERREQRCDMEAMSRIAKADGSYSPDKVIAYTFGDTVEKGNSFRAPGAVFRSKGEWYRLKYRCVTAEDGLKVLSFEYKVGGKVPRGKWQQYYLYD